MLIFLGLTDDFLQFELVYLQIALLLSNLLKQGTVFQIGQIKEVVVINKLKGCLTEAPVLPIYIV